MTGNLPIQTTEEEASPIEEALKLVRILAENSATGLASDAAALQRQSISQTELSNRLRLGGAVLLKRGRHGVGVEA